MTEIQKPKYTVVWIACIAFILFLIGSLLFIFHIRSNNEKEMATYLEDVTAQRKAAIVQQVNGDIQLLRGVSTSLSEMTMDDSESILRILNNINKGNTFIRMGIADLHGKTALVDLDGNIYRDIDLSGHKSFKRALKGEESVSSTFYEEQTKEYVNYYMVPIYKGEKMVRVLCAVDKAEVLEKLIDVSVFQGKGYFGIINSEGTIVGPTVDPNPEVKLGASVYELADMTEEQSKQMHSVLVTGNSEEFVFPVFGNENWAVVEPLGINDWSIISVVPRESLNEYFNRTAIGVVILVIFSSAFFIFLLLWQIRSTNRYQLRLEDIAYIDQLTGLRNQTRFNLDVQSLLQHKRRKKYAVWSMDIKSFNTVNDIFSNEIGNKLLIYLGDFFKEIETPCNFTARTAADNFVGVHEYNHKEELEKFFQTIKQVIKKRDFIDETEKKIDFAMGFYCVDDFEEELTVEEIINRSIIAKKFVKNNTGSSMMFFSKSMSDKLHWNAILEASAQEALDKGEMIFLLQPKVNIQGEFTVTSAEVLARWNHPEYGIISPGDFIPLFEANGFIVDFDRYIFRKACEWFVDFKSRFHIPLKIAINVSRQGLLRDDMIPYYTGVKKDLGIPDNYVELEFTESVILEDFDLFRNTVIKLQQEGFMCSIDDFGAGYSSMNVLKNLPIDVLKLDALFMKGSDENLERSQIIITDFIKMAHKLDIITVAEGVEMPNQVDFLVKAKCDLVQGYVFSKPIPPMTFEEFINKDDGKVRIKP